MAKPLKSLVYRGSLCVDREHVFASAIAHIDFYDDEVYYWAEADLSENGPMTKIYECMVPFPYIYFIKTTTTYIEGHKPFYAVAASCYTTIYCEERVVRHLYIPQSSDEEVDRTRAEGVAQAIELMLEIYKGDEDNELFGHLLEIDSSRFRDKHRMFPEDLLEESNANVLHGVYEGEPQDFGFTFRYFHFRDNPPFPRILIPGAVFKNVDIHGLDHMANRSDVAYALGFRNREDYLHFLELDAPYQGQLKDFEKVPEWDPRLIPEQASAIVIFFERDCEPIFIYSLNDKDEVYLDLVTECFRRWTYATYVQRKGIDRTTMNNARFKQRHFGFKK